MRVRAKQNGGQPTPVVPPESFIPEGGQSGPADDNTQTSHNAPTDANHQDGEISSVESDREIVRHLQRARDLLAVGQFEGALVEIESVRRICPADEQATRIEQLILTKQTESMRRRVTADEVAALLTSTNRLRSLHRYGEALREIERASRLEPHNPSIQKCVAEIRQQMTDLASPSIDELLEKAEESRQCKDYTSALNSIAEAYEIAPENKEVRKLEMAIRREELLQHESG
jgi:tetratricopeptide (TPR) repeat protein